MTINSKEPSVHPTRIPLRTPATREQHRMLTIAELRREQPYLLAYARSSELAAGRVDVAELETRHRSLQGRALRVMRAEGLDVPVREQDGSGKVQTAQDGRLTVSAGEIVVELDQQATR